MSTDDPFGAAIDWIVALLLGPAATGIAVTAVAGFGIAMLQGQLSARDSLRVMLGCFILFGASSIAHGFMDMASGSPNAPDIITPVDHPPITTPSRPPTQYDPYAGASVPQ